MAISTRMPRNPVTPSAQSPSTGARPSSSRPSSVKNSMAASMSSTTMPTLSIRLTVMLSPWRLTFDKSGGQRAQPPGRPLDGRVGRLHELLVRLEHGSHLLVNQVDGFEGTNQNLELDDLPFVVPLEHVDSIDADAINLDLEF